MPVQAQSANNGGYLSKLTSNLKIKPTDYNSIQPQSQRRNIKLISKMERGIKTTELKIESQIA